jgi:chaperonin cofactor prefoldin
MASFGISSDRRPYDAQQKALAATVELRKQREEINLEIQLLQGQAKKLSEQIRAIERSIYSFHMDSTSRSQ